MKTMKILMIAAILSVAGISQLSADGLSKNPNNNVVYLYVTQLGQVPGLAQAIQRELDPVFLKRDQPYYTVTFRWLNYIYVITGTYKMWSNFYWPKPVMPGTTRSSSGEIN